MNRRGFLGAMLAACAAPAIVRAESLMRIAPVAPPQGFVLTAGGLYTQSGILLANPVGPTIREAAATELYKWFVGREDEMILKALRGEL